MATFNQVRLGKQLGDGQRPTKFEAMVVMGSGSKTHDEAFQALIKTSSFPSIKQEPLIYKYKGREFPMRGIPKYDTSWSCTFYLQENHELKVVLEDWLLSSTSETFSKRSEGTKKFDESGMYKTFLIFQRDFNDENNTVQYELKNVFPKSINTLEVNYGIAGSVLELTVEFGFSHFVYKPLDGEDDTLVGLLMGKLMGAAQNAINGAVSAVTGKIKNAIPTPKNLLNKLTSGYDGAIVKMGGKSPDRARMVEELD